MKYIQGRNCIAEGCYYYELLASWEKALLVSKVPNLYISGDIYLVVYLFSSCMMSNSMLLVPLCNQVLKIVIGSMFITYLSQDFEGYTNTNRKFDDE